MDEIQKLEPTPKKKPRVRRSFGPYKFDKKAAKSIIKSLSIGCWMSVAAATAGVSTKTVYTWLRQGARKTMPELEQFLKDYKKATAMAARLHMQQIFASAMNGNTKDSKWFLERRYPKRWARTIKTQLTGANGGPVAVKEVRTSDERRARMLELAKKAAELTGEAAGTGAEKDDDEGSETT